MFSSLQTTAGDFNTACALSNNSCLKSPSTGCRRHCGHKGGPLGLILKEQGKGGRGGEGLGYKVSHQLPSPAVFHKSKITAPILVPVFVTIESKRNDP